MSKLLLSDLRECLFHREAVRIAATEGDILIFSTRLVFYLMTLVAALTTVCFPPYLHFAEG